MPEKWDDAYYRERAKAWRDKAATLPADHPERAVSFELADGYDRLQPCSSSGGASSAVALSEIGRQFVAHRVLPDQWLTGGRLGCARLAANYAASRSAA